MRRTTVLAALVALALVPRADAATGVWAPTFPNELGTQTYLDSTRDGTVVAIVGGHLVSSSDYGVTWTPGNPLSAPPGGGSSETRVATMSKTSWIAENGVAVSVTSDRGASWHPVSVTPVVANPRERFEYATNVAAADGSATALLGWGGFHVRGLCPWALPFTPVFTTHDAGAHWKRTDLPVTGDVWSAQWLDAKHAAVSVAEIEWSRPEGDERSCSSTGEWVASSVWTTADGGAHWRRAIHSDEWFIDAAWTSPTTLVMIGETNGTARSYVSLDGGRTFRAPVKVYANPVVPGNGGSFNGFPALGFGTARRGWVSACISGIYRTDNGGSEWAHEVSGADNNVWGVGDLTVMDGARAVAATPQSVFTRYGDVGAVPAAPVAPATAGPRVTTIARGPLSFSLTAPVSGPVSARVAYAR